MLLMHCPFYAINFFLEFVVAKIDDLVNWARRVSLTIIIIYFSHSRKKRCHSCDGKYSHLFVASNLRSSACKV